MTALRRLLRKNGISQAEACRRTGIHPGVMSRLCSGKRKPTPTVARQLAQMLDVGPDRLGFGPLSAANEATAALKTASKRVDRLESEANRLVEAANAVVEALDKIEVSIATAKQKLRDVLKKNP